MKRVFVILVCLVGLFGISSCDNSDASKTEWSESDFMFYDKDGKEIGFTTIGENNIKLSDYPDCSTHREVAIGDRAKTAIEKYEFSVGYAIYGFGEDEIPKTLDKAVDISKEIEKAAIEETEFYITVICNEEFKPIKFDVDWQSDNLYQSGWMFGIEVKDEKISDIYITNNK